MLDGTRSELEATLKTLMQCHESALADFARTKEDLRGICDAATYRGNDPDIAMLASDMAAWLHGLRLHGCAFLEELRENMD